MVKCLPSVFQDLGSFPTPCPIKQRQETEVFDSKAIHLPKAQYLSWLPFEKKEPEESQDILVSANPWRLLIKSDKVKRNPAGSAFPLCESLLFNAMAFAFYLFNKHLHCMCYASEAVLKTLRNHLV